VMVSVVSLGAGDGSNVQLLDGGYAIIHGLFCER